jgi:fructose-1,6-bisphosphatase/inositol monophosphatase family enzyme
VGVYSRLKPWDHLPGSLIVREAGGVVKKWDGADYGVRDHYAGLIVTNSQDGFDAVYEAMFGGIDIKPYIAGVF